MQSNPAVYRGARLIYYNGSGVTSCAQLFLRPVNMSKTFLLLCRLRRFLLLFVFAFNSYESLESQHTSITSTSHLRNLPRWKVEVMVHF